LTLDPEITAIMTGSKNYEELEWAWKEWRDNSGKLMRTDYKKYVDLVNKAAVLNGN
jgi:peptidyl-dipeptidase A